MVQWVSSRLPYFLSLLAAGVTVAMFAWIFDLARRGIFSGSAKAMKSLRHGWVRFGITTTDTDIESTKGAMAAPHLAIGEMIVAVFILIYACFLVIASLICLFITTYFPPRGLFAKVYGNYISIEVVIIVMGVALIFGAVVTFDGALSRLRSPEKRLQKLNRRKAALEARAITDAEQKLK